LILWIVLMICVWQRQAWARIAIALLLFWGITNLMTTGLRMGGSMASAASLAFPLLIAIMRACAVYLLFRPDSNAWFKK
jgi:hypothetical protein